MKLFCLMCSAIGALLLLQSRFVIAIDVQELDRAMNDALRLLDIRGASIAYFDKSSMDEPILKGYGHTASSDSSPRVTKDTAFMLASVSKVFVGTAVMILVDKGIIGLDDDICNVLPADWEQSACRNPRFPNDPVTWRMLVTHRSSLMEDVPSYVDASGKKLKLNYGPNGGYGGYAAGGDCPLDDVVGFYRDVLINKPTETNAGSDNNVNWYQFVQQNGGAWQRFRPGSRISYSNFAVGYLAVLIEFASGITFPEFCKTNIFEPLGMTRTAWFRRDLPDGTQEAMPVEAGWRRDRHKDLGHYCFIDYASGSLRTTANDLSKFLDSMMNYGPSIYSLDKGKQAFSCLEQGAGGRPITKNCYFGANWIRLENSQKRNAEFWVEKFKGWDWTDGVQHAGYESGSQTQIIVLPKAGIYALALTNTDMNDKWAAQKMVRALVRVAGPDNNDDNYYGDDAYY